MKNTKNLALSAFFTAMTAVLSQVIIPIGPVPLSMATFAVFCAGAFLGAKYGAISQAVYLLLGVAGVPVFSSFTGGIGKLTGPTGGYIIGYVAAAWLIGFITEKLGRKLHIIVLSMLAGFVAYMILGTLWYMYVTGSGLAAAFAVCVAPFLPGDAVKIAIAASISYRLRPSLSPDR